MSEETTDVQIRIAGNTGNPALLSIRAKGFELAIEYWQAGDGTFRAQYDALKESSRFSATSPEELLGLIAIWETRGREWKTRPDEFNLVKELDKSARFFDSDGNELPRDKTSCVSASSAAGNSGE